ncbi:LysR family transcriptional regulator [Erwinia psidii]|uniref:LysR family transcriptional regulator n=1 Tax=Erwinia psidii TaxID=69224 RepID=A0A3N6TMW4_9GAMM|nr:LysR family transcriptional regulator [Erwinia psidii]MCX8956370.1 LysR family transcriptional regulator [Erwinia psidii]MCX8959872.1 LysR family transcriptional regulator [Erwinia psidii]MCX8966504.1 LysR family transcriptional regulator [Erwinia psidii]RQM36572.1 LysR family transcriptional regulator [Erwinia psidii]
MFVSSNLKCFIVLAREKSLKKASEILFVTSSPISRRIKLFEDELGYKLFSRTDHDFTLTKKGLELYEKIMPYYMKISEIEASFSQKTHSLNIKRSLMIGVENLNHFLFNILVKKRKKTESVSYCSSDAAKSLESLLSGEVQAVISHREIAENGISTMEFYSEPICYLLAKGIERYQVSDMKKIPIIIPRNGFHEHYIKTAHMKILNTCPNAQVIIVDDIDNYLFLIKSGDAVGLMSESMVLFYKNKHCFDTDLNYSIDRSFPELKTYIYCLKECEKNLKTAMGSILSEYENNDIDCIR